MNTSSGERGAFSGCATADFFLTDLPDSERVTTDVVGCDIYFHGNADVLRRVRLTDHSNKFCNVVDIEVVVDMETETGVDPDLSFAIGRTEMRRNKSHFTMSAMMPATSDAFTVFFPDHDYRSPWNLFSANLSVGPQKTLVYRFTIEQQKTA